jgi:hypothetical protein
VAGRRITYLRTAWFPAGEGFLYLGVVVDACSRRWWLAMAESFFATLKAEPVHRQAWLTRHELEMEMEGLLLHRGLPQPAAPAQPAGQPQPDRVPEDAHAADDPERGVRPTGATSLVVVCHPCRHGPVDVSIATAGPSV